MTLKPGVTADDISDLLPSVLQNVAYISASINIAKISILIVSRQRHS